MPADVADVPSLIARFSMRVALLENRRSVGSTSLKRQRHARKVALPSVSVRTTPPFAGRSET